MSLNRSLAILSVSSLLAGAAFAQANDTSNSAVIGRPSVGYPYGGTTAAPFLFSNGTFITGLGNGSGGANTSEITATYNTFGYGSALSTGFRIADNFTVPSGQAWDLTTMHWFAYQTNSTTTPTITSINVRIWAGSPFGGGTVLAGDTTTNRLTSSTFSGVYRVTPTTLTSIARPIMDCTVDMTWAPVLAPGTYYVDVQVGGTLASGPWAPPTAPAQQGGPSTDNGEQFSGTTLTWALTQDGTALVPQDFPFTLAGDDGVSTCPASFGYCTNLISSSGCSPAIGSSGVASLTNPGGFTVTCSALEDNKNGLIFFGTTGTNSAPFFGGTLCVAPTLYRLPVQGSGGAATCSGTMSNTLADYLAHPSGGSLVIAGAVVNSQGWFRDPAAAFTVGLTGGLEFTVCP